jgi:exopolysaccharide biosynthesis polyprenyl glycosylphosphotransferase
MFGRTAQINSLKLLDLVIMTMSFMVATAAMYHLTHVVPFNQFLSMRVKIGNIILFFGILYFWSANLSIFQLYQSHRLNNNRIESLELIKAISLGTFILFIISLVFKIRLITPLFLIIFFFVNVSACVLSRLSLRYLLAFIRRNGRNLRSLLIVGSNPRALRFVQQIQERPEMGYRVLGFVDNEWDGAQRVRKANLPLQGDLTQFPSILREQVVDEVAIFLPMKSLYGEISRIVSQCEEQGIIVRIPTDIFETRTGGTKDEPIDPEMVLTIYPGAIRGWQAVVKRATDFFLSLALLLTVSPLLVAVALLVKFNSPGPIFFVQERLGLNKRRFLLYKFRTMVPDAERQMAALEHLNEVDGPAFKIKNDPRITKIGKYLRKTSIDEFPQLINVLRGDMSLVGPRPLPVRDYTGFSQDWQRRRFSVKPGMTCLWQIGGRSEISFDRWMRLDLQYIDQWSLWLDLKILAKTIPAVFRREGAV